jgi:tRNA(fMet)-specific endonuclease VapC
MERVILDTTVLVATERGTYDPETMDPADPAVPAITVAEFRSGILRSTDHARRVQSEAFLAQLLDVLTVEDYTLQVAEHHAELLAHTQTVGRPRGAHDLIIAATARATKRTILTLDRRAAFDDLPGVEARVLPARS